MKYSDLIEIKTQTIFRVIKDFLDNKTPPSFVESIIREELTNARPALLLSVLREFVEFTAREGHKENKRILSFFAPYLLFHQSHLPKNHPLSKYSIENKMLLAKIVKIDVMEDEEATPLQWKKALLSIEPYKIHINKISENYLEVFEKYGHLRDLEKTKAIINQLLNTWKKTKRELTTTKHVDFLLSMGKLMALFVKFIYIQEKMLFPTSLNVFQEDSWLDLMRKDNLIDSSFPDVSSKNESPNISVGKPKKTKARKITALEYIYKSILKSKKSNVKIYSIKGELLFININEEDETSNNPIPKSILKALEQEKKPIHFLSNNRLTTFGLVDDKATGSTYIYEMIENLNIMNFDQNQVNNITLESKISTLFAKHPQFRYDFFSLDKELEGLRDPTNAQLLENATISMIAIALRAEPKELLEKIVSLISNY